jgi:recombination protein RecA
MKKKIIEESTDLSKIVDAFSKIVKANSEKDLFGKPTWFLHSGILALDYIMSGIVDGTGGYPGGRVIEIHGPPSTGKSLLLSLAAASHQRNGGLVVIEDAEKRWDVDFATFHGVDASKTIPFTIDTIEEFCVKTIDLLHKSIDMGADAPRLLFLLDSVATLSTLKEVDDKGTKADQGRRAQRMKAAMRVLPSLIYQTQSILIATNHVTANVGVMYGPKTTTPTGSGIPFQASTRLEMFTAKQIKLANKNRPIGIVMRIRCTKNSITIPFGECAVSMYWATGVDKYSGLLDLAVDLDILTEDRKVYTYNTSYKSEVKFKGHEFKTIMENYPEILLDEKWTKPYFTKSTEVEEPIEYEESEI